MTTPVENEQYINRDISWLEFNARVLGEASDKGNALLERLKFIAIFSSNLDEFYMVRVAGVKQQLGEPFKKIYGDCGYVPAELMNRLDTRIRALVDRQYRLLYKEILPELAQNGISLLAWKDLTQEKRDALRKHFISNWLPILTPIGIDSSHPFPQVPNLGLELLVRLRKENDDRERFAVLEVPSLIPRFIEVISSRTTLRRAFFWSAICISVSRSAMDSSSMEKSMSRVMRNAEHSRIVHLLNRRSRLFAISSSLVMNEAR